MKNFTWLKVLNSPFKRPRLKWYVGKIAIGVPYFFPRKWVKFTYEDALQKAVEDSKNERLIHFGKNPLDLVQSNLNYSKAIPLKIGFSYCDLGWKTKWEDTDYRFEWSPILSFVFFKLQIACWVSVYNSDQYWTAWLYYELNTDKTKSKLERIQQCIKEFPQTYRVSSKGETKTVDYYKLGGILKDGYSTDFGM